MNLPLLYERWLEEIQSGVAEPPVSLLKYQRMGMGRKIEFLSGLGFSEHFAEAIKDMLFESDEFDLAIYNCADGSGQNGNVRALKALNSARDRVMSEAVQLKSLMVSPTFEAELMKRLAKKALPKVSSDKAKDIEDEIAG